MRAVTVYPDAVIQRLIECVTANMSSAVDNVDQMTALSEFTGISGACEPRTHHENTLRQKLLLMSVVRPSPVQRAFGEGNDASGIARPGKFPRSTSSGRAPRRVRSAASRASVSMLCHIASGLAGSNSSAVRPLLQHLADIGLVGAMMARPAAMYSNSFSGEA